VSLASSIFLFGYFDKQMSEKVVTSLLEFEEQGFQDSYIYINSDGGRISDLDAILDTFTKVRNSGMKIHTIVTGIGASCGSILSLNGDKGLRQVGSNAEIYTHSTQYMEWGGENEFEEALALIKAENDKFAVMLSENANFTIEEAREFIKESTSMNAKDAIKNGICDSIWDSKELDEEIKEYSLVASLKKPDKLKLKDAKRFFNEYGKKFKPKKEQKKENNMPKIEQEDFDKLQNKFDKLENKFTKLNDQLESSKAENKKLSDKIEADKLEVEAKVNERKDVLIAQAKKVVLKDKVNEVEDLLTNSKHLEETKFNALVKSTINIFVDKEKAENFVKTSDDPITKEEKEKQEFIAGFADDGENEMQNLVYGKGGK
jgi:ATP-dependent Clp protease protease subunit